MNMELERTSERREQCMRSEAPRESEATLTGSGVRFKANPTEAGLPQRSTPHCAVHLPQLSVAPDWDLVWIVFSLTSSPACAA